MAAYDVAPFTTDRLLRVVVESPRGSRVKHEHDPAHGYFRINRPLPAGLAYPLDWGFVPGTRSGDGDPIDAMVMGDQDAYPGVVIETTVVAMLDVHERPQGKRAVERNPRLVTLPHWYAPALGAAMLDAGLRDALAAFLVRVGEAAGKTIVSTAWAGADDALRFVRAHRR